MIRATEPPGGRRGLDLSCWRRPRGGDACGVCTLWANVPTIG